jgi:small-conductance mechanosensitive channel
MAAMHRELEEARLNEINLRFELESVRMEAFIQDSVKRREQRIRIDSLRNVTNGYPVTVESDTLFRLYAKRGGLLPEVRAANISEAVLRLGKRFMVKPDSIYLESTDISTDIMYGHEVIASFTDQDALWENTTRDSLATVARILVYGKVRELQKRYGLEQFIKQCALFLAIFLLQTVLILLTNRLYRKGVRKINRLQDSKLKSITFNNYELLDTQKQVHLFTFAASLIRYLLIIIQLIILVPLLFSIFPQTQELAHRLFSYIWNPLKSILNGAVDYIPNLFTIIIIWLVMRYLVKGIKYIAGEIATGKLKIGGFYPDWAQPSFQIIRFLLYVFMIAMIYPYLPGSDGQVFQGISVFVGIIISLGSTSVITNVMAGLVITYMRPFKIGDRIKLNDLSGNVLEKTPFVTRIKTIKNEIITIPNSFILTSHTINYSASARNHGLIIHTEISFGFDVPWEEIHRLLTEAAAMTEGVETDPPPFVHDLSFEDFYPIYQINAYIRDADRTAQIKSDMLKHIRELADIAGIELLSPHYITTRAGNEKFMSKKFGKENNSGSHGGK